MALWACFSILIKIQVEDAAALTNLFLNILDGVINDGTIDKNLINAEKLGLILKNNRSWENWGISRYLI